MQPDRPQLCRFWLAGHINALSAAVSSPFPGDALMAIRCLTSFLWQYTWASMPQPLRIPLLEALDAAVVSLAGGLDHEFAITPPHLRGTNTDIGKEAETQMEFQKDSAEACKVAALVLEGDPVFCAWRDRANQQGTQPRFVLRHNLGIPITDINQWISRCAVDSLPSG